VDANGLKRPELIHPGDRLTLPALQGLRHAHQAHTAATAHVAPTSQRSASDVRAIFDPALGSRARGAVIIGQAEGTRTPSGGFRAAYYGHVDPGNGVGNRGSFSLQHAGDLTPEQADAQQLARLSRQIPAFETAARAAGLDPNNATLATGYLDLYNARDRASSTSRDRRSAATRRKRRCNGRSAPTSPAGCRRWTRPSPPAGRPDPRRPAPWPVMPHRGSPAAPGSI
jgi:hypothetical protein